MSMSDAEDVSLEDALGAALDETSAAPVEGQQEQAQTREYNRDEGGRFTAKQEQQAEQQQAVEQQEQQTQPKLWRANWYKDEWGAWDKYPEAFRNALRDQERAAQQGIEKFSTAAKAWEPLNEVLKPFEAQLKAQGQTPQQFIGGLVNIYGYLQQDPVQALDWLAQNTLGQGWTIRELARWMEEQGHQGHKVDPLQQELAALKQQVQQLSQAPQTQAREAANRQIAEWAKDKPDFDTVRPIMAALVKQNPEASLDDLYEQARYAHPDTRGRLLQEMEDKRLAALKDKRAAGAQSPRGGTPTQGANPRFAKAKTTIEEDVAAALDASAGVV